MVKRLGFALKTVALPVLLVVAVGIALVWEIASRFSARPFAPFTLTAAAFEGFGLDITGWSVSAVPVSTNSPFDPDILAFMARRGSRSAMIRLVHGYNMPMCMKIKGYTVEEVGQTADRRLQTKDHRPQTEDRGPQTTDHGPRTTDHGLQTGEGHTSMPFQTWRVTSSIGETTVWLTTMLRAGDYEPTVDDVRSMPFPRVATPDDPRWKPEGLTWASLRHPIREIRTRLRARWNSSRTDVLTFLRLRRPAWASEELLTLVSCSLTPLEEPAAEEQWINDLTELQNGFTRSLQAWQRSQAGRKAASMDAAAW